MVHDDDRPELVLRSESEAWDALKRAMEGEGFPDDLRVRFDGWPTLTLDVKGRDWHSTVPTRVMPPLMDVQNSINLAYAQVQYNELSTRRLRNEERDSLELVVKVEPGSSLLSSEMWEQLTKVASAAVGRMTGTEIVICVTVIALSAAGGSMFKAWMRSRREARRLTNHLELSREETERLRVMANAVQPRPQLAAVQEEAQAASSQLLKATRAGDVIEIHGVPIAADEAHALAQPERERAKDVELSGHFAILGNRTDKGAGFRITVKRVSDGLTFATDVLPELPASQKDVIRDAEWSKRIVDLVVQAEKLRDSIQRAHVASAVAVESTVDPHVTPLKPRH